MKTFDYTTQGAYFVTICACDKQCLFGKIYEKALCHAEMRYSPLGEVARQCLLNVEDHYENVCLDQWVIMPNHVHLLIQIKDPKEPNSSIHYDLSNIVGKYKAAVTRAAGKLNIYSNPIWQKSFHERVVRNEAEYLKIWNYISGNPSKWLNDCFYCE